MWPRNTSILSWRRLSPCFLCIARSFWHGRGVLVSLWLKSPLYQREMSRTQRYVFRVLPNVGSQGLTGKDGRRKSKARKRKEKNRGPWEWMAATSRSVTATRRCLRNGRRFVCTRAVINAILHFSHVPGNNTSLMSWRGSPVLFPCAKSCWHLRGVLVLMNQKQKLCARSPMKS